LEPVIGFGYLDIDDLKNSQFDISILSKPVLLNSVHDPTTSSSDAEDVVGEDDAHNDGDSKSSTASAPTTASATTTASAPTSASCADNSLVLSSKYGQLYQCSMPDDLPRMDVKEDSEDVSSESVVKLLSPMKDGPCLFYTKGWWSYEFCYGREVKQYHFENGAIRGETISLGKFESDYNWEATEEWEASSKSPSKMRKHHSQYYVDGSTCDLTGEPRKTEVRFKCDDTLTSTDMEMIREIEEPSSCTYLFTISTIRICSHPRFRERKIKKAASISCSPALSKHEYEKYTKLQETTAKRVKEMGDRLRSLNAKYEEKLEQKDKEAAEKLQRLPRGKDSKLSPSLEKFFREVYSPNKKGKDVSSKDVQKGETDDEEDDEEDDSDSEEIKDDSKSDEKETMGVREGTMDKFDEDHEKKMQEDEEYRLRVMMIKKKHRNLYKSMMKNRRKRMNEAKHLERKRKDWDDKNIPKKAKKSKIEL